jgi:hypothetical protein
MSRLLIAVAFLVALAADVAGQVRLVPPRQDVQFLDEVSFAIIGVPVGTTPTVAIRYPTGSRTGWLRVVSLSSNEIRVRAEDPADPAPRLNTGTYIAYVDVTVGLITRRGIVVLNRVRDSRRFRFLLANQNVGDELDITPLPRSLPIAIDFEFEGAPNTGKDYRIVAMANDPGLNWLAISPGSGRTVSEVTLTADSGTLSSRTEPYTGTLLVYDPADPDTQAALLVSMQVTGTASGARLTSAVAVPFTLQGPLLANGENGWWIDVPAGSQVLSVRATSNVPVNIYARRDQDVAITGSQITADAGTSAASLQPALDIVPPALQPGRYFIALQIPNAAVASGFIGAEVSAVPNVTQRNPIMSQVAAGQDWKTTVILVNPTDSVAGFRLRFRTSDGVDWPLALARIWPNPGELGTVTALADNIPANGMFMYETRTPRSVPVRSGYAELVEGTAVKGQAIYQLMTASGIDYEAAVPMAPPSASFFLPFDNQQTGGVTTISATALVNPGPASQLTARVRDEMGQLLTTGNLNYNAGQHTADFLVNMVGNAANGRRGTVEFEGQGGAQFAGLGLRARGPFTSLAVITTDGTPTTNQFIPQIATGGTWSTTLLLVNPTSNQQRFTLRFRQGTGAEWSLPLRRVGPSQTDFGRVTTVTETIPPYGLYTYETTDPTISGSQSGYAELVEGSALRGQAIFQQNTNLGSYEAAVPMRPGVRRFVMPFEKLTSGGRETLTALALVNTGSIANVVTARIRDASGQLLRTTQTSLAPGEHLVDTIPRLFGSALTTSRGTIEFEGSTADLVAIGLRYRGSFTSFAVIPK